jgi:thymidylate synthase (FAD)
MKVEYVNHMGDDLAVVNAARVSFAKTSQELSLGDKGLINFLAKHNHWTPFAHTAITLRMQAPIPVRTQCFKHKVGLTENEESRRYISTVPDYFTPLQFRQKADDKKQGSGEPFNGHANASLRNIYKKHLDEAIELYQDLVDEWGVCEEQARFVLPQGCEVNWIWTGNLVSFANFVNKRSASDAQGEIQILAKQVNDVIAPLYSHSWAALTSK